MDRRGSRVLSDHPPRARRRHGGHRCAEVVMIEGAEFETIKKEPPPRGNGADQTQRRPRFQLVPFDELTVGSRAVYLVKGIIPKVGLVVIWGPPKCGKSYLIFTIMLHVALGWEYRGRRV